jgi:hypothetical protein
LAEVPSGERKGTGHDGEENLQIIPHAVRDCSPVSLFFSSLLSWISRPR